MSGEIATGTRSVAVLGPVLIVISGCAPASLPKRLTRMGRPMRKGGASGMGDPAAGAGSQCDPTQLGSLITPTAERRQLPSPWQERRVLVGATVDL